MPIENEYKFLLHDPDGLLEHSLNLRPDFQKIDIRQGYLRKGCRVRQWREGTTERFIFSYKQRVDDDIIEIETDISGDDFARLWRVIEKPIEKVRFKKTDADAVWDVDFLKHKGATYFALAEVELSPEVREVPRILNSLKDYTLGRMERHCKALANKRLSDQRYAAQVMAAFVQNRPATPDSILAAHLIDLP